jgi:hypothetical protein
LYETSNPSITRTSSKLLENLQAYINKISFQDPHKKLQAQKTRRIMWIPSMHLKYENPSQEDPSLSKKSKTQSESQRGKGTNYVSRNISINERHT